MHQAENEEQQTNVTKTTLSNLRATLAAKENPEPYTGPSAPTPLPGQSYSTQDVLTQDLDFPTPVSKNLEKPQNDDA